MKKEIKSALKHLRPAFSLLLMPVFLFALSSTDSIHPNRLLLSFFVLHLLVYPASNGYNSLMDKDEGSIGGLKKPPPAPAILFPITLAMDCFALIITYIVHPASSIILLSYIVASRLYSWRGLRIKKYPITGFFWVIIFQGAVIYWFSLSMFYGNLNIFSEFSSKYMLGMILSSLMISSSYPLTQVYQHAQDKKDRVLTISMLLGIKNTFRFSRLMILIFTLTLTIFLINYGRWWDIFVFLVLNLPASYHFFRWNRNILLNEKYADYTNTMKMSVLGAMGTNLFFLYMIFMNTLEI